MLKGIVLAGGSGTRLYPITRGLSKQLLPIYDKPMIYYPLSTLMLAGIRDILIITTPMDDNIFFGHGLPELLAKAAANQQGATVFAYHVRDPERYGVVTFDEKECAVRIDEKPTHPSSNWAITGLYFFDNDVVRYASQVRPSARGELEITDLQTCYLSAGALHVERMGRGFAWLDTGTFQSLIDAASFVQTLETRQGMKVACLEEIAFRQGFIDREQLIDLAKPLAKSGYGAYLTDLVGSI